MSPALTQDLVRERLYALLPTIYRMRDFGQGEPLRALLLLLENELALVESDIARLYDNWFIETCDEWAVPYLGDLIGARLLHSVHARAFTANSLAYKRRKGTVQTLGALARDITGWSAQSVEFMPLVVTSQHVNSPLPTLRATPSLRAVDALDNISTPFDSVARSVDIRARGRFHPGQLGIYVWRSDVSKIEWGATVPIAAGIYAVSPFGNPQSIWSPVSSRAGLEAPTDLKQAPQPIRRRILLRALEARRQALVDGRTLLDPYFDPEPVLRVFYRDGVGKTIEVPPEQMVAADLSNPWRPPSQLTYKRSGDGKPVQRKIVLAVDPDLGRIAFSSDVSPQKVWATFYVGAAGGFGGGGYERTLLDAGQSTVFSLSGGEPQTTLINLWDPNQWPALPTDGQVPNVVIELADSDVYKLGPLSVPDGFSLTIRAKSRKRPTLQCQALIQNVKLGNGSKLVLEGVAISGGGLALVPFSPTGPDFSCKLVIRHSTLLPGLQLAPDGQPMMPNLPSLSLSAGFQPGNVQVEVHQSVTGPILIDGAALSACDSVIDAPRRLGPAVVATSVKLARVTVLGACTVTRVEAIKDSLLTERLTVVDRDSSTFAVTYSVLPYDATLGPITYRCQPFLSVNEAQTSDEKRKLIDTLRPQLTSSRYGMLGYAQLDVRTSSILRSAASDQGEPGAFHNLQQALRESNLLDSQAEYLRSGLSLNLFVVT